jgi:hypothetical protein
MTIRAYFVRPLDRPSGRRARATLASTSTNRLNRGDAFHVDYYSRARAWVRSAAGEHLVAGPKFTYDRGHLLRRDGASPWSAEACDYWFPVSTLKARDTVVDVGAEVGSDVPASARAVGPSGLFIPPEAHPETFRMSERPVIRNGDTQVRCVHAAVAGMQESLSRTRHACIECHDSSADAGDGGVLLQPRHSRGAAPVAWFCRDVPTPRRITGLRTRSRTRLAPATTDGWQRIRIAPRTAERSTLPARSRCDHVPVVRHRPPTTASPGPSPHS